MNTLISAYENYFNELRYLPLAVKNDVRELVFSYRKGVESICLVLASVETLTLLVPNLPKDFFTNTYYRYAVDLDSVNNEIIRVYRDDSTYVLVGYYIDSSGSVIETKHYKRSTNKNEICIDRYDSDNNLISADEKEISSTEDQWKGQQLVTLIAKQHNFNTIYLKKVDKDQCYVRVRDL